MGSALRRAAPWCGEAAAGARAGPHSQRPAVFRNLLASWWRLHEGRRQPLPCSVGLARNLRAAGKRSPAADRNDKPQVCPHRHAVGCRDVGRPGRSRVGKAVGDRRPRRPLERLQHDRTATLTPVGADRGCRASARNRWWQTAQRAAGRPAPSAACSTAVAPMALKTWRSVASRIGIRVTTWQVVARWASPDPWLPRWACKAHSASHRRSHAPVPC